MTGKVRIGSGLFSALFLMSAHSANAQTCIGMPTLGSTVKVLSTTGIGRGSERDVVGRFGMNGQRIFAGVQAGYTSRQSDFAKPTDPILGFDVGYAFQLGGAGGVELCPVLQSLYVRGPRGTDFTGSAITTTFGLSVGRTFKFTNSFGLVPFVQGDCPSAIRPTGPAT